MIASDGTWTAARPASWLDWVGFLHRLPGDARRHHLVVRGPDVNLSVWPFTAKGERWPRVGLMQVKGAREDEVHALLEERQRNGPYTHQEGLLQRVDLSIPTIEVLASGGAFDCWAPDGDRTGLYGHAWGAFPPGYVPNRRTPLSERNWKWRSWA